MTTRSTLTHLECSRTGAQYPADQLMNLSPASGKPLLARYDLAAAARTLTPESLATRPKTMWRYEEVLPVQRRDAIVSLGEGWTPLVHATRLGKAIGCANPWILERDRRGWLYPRDRVCIP